MAQEIYGLNEGLEGLATDFSFAFDAIGEGLQTIGLSLDRIWSCSEEILHSIERNSNVLHQDLQDIATAIAEETKEMAQIHKDLGRPYEKQVLELRDKADLCLKTGMARLGRDRVEYYEDAYRLFQECAKNPIGRQDYVVFHELGWIEWKHLNDLELATESFYRATRLSDETGDAYFIKSARHLAYVQYKAGNNPAALDSICRCMKASRAPEILFDAARYAAVNSQVTLACDLLDEAIRLSPKLYAAMLSEEDLLS
ncbi:MAG: hypothetical protein P4L46_25465 [Fimbriimonas sp.]|nr:hypothetical protein [Fimbriimonas sp.]